MVKHTHPMGWRNRAFGSTCLADAVVPSAGESRLVLSAILLLWIVSVSIVSAQHVVWRDEVRTLSVATFGSFQTMLANTKYEGHPLLWYLIVRAAWLVYSGPIVLKIVSVAIGFGAVSLFLLRGPFPLWFRCLVIFGLPFCEYSVVARDYGISMLLMFLFAELSTQDRPKPLLAGLMLFLLANTNAHSVMLAILLLGIWCVQLFSTRDGHVKHKSAAAGALLAAAGIVLSVATLARTGGSNQVAPRPALSGAVHALPAALLNPGASFTELTAMNRVAPRTSGIFGWSSGTAKAFAAIVSTVIILLGIGGLARRPLLAAAALAAVWSLVAFFDFIYPGGYRHEGLFVAFILTLYWIARRPFSARSPVFPITLVPLLIPLVPYAVAKDVSQFLQPASSNRDLGRLLKSRPDLSSAILVAVPDYMLESIPYYIHNKFYFLCPIPQAPFISFKPAAKCQLNLNDVLTRVRGLHASTGVPVVLLMAPELKDTGGEADAYFYHFTWNTASIAALHERAELLSSFRNASSDENYEAYLFN